LTALAAAAPALTVVPPSPTAPFSATRGDLKFDRACRTVTVAMLASSPACGARVARGETGPTIEVVLASHQAAPTAETLRAALPLLERAIAAEGHPAALYLAGAMLTTGELLQPDFARGVPLLERAAAGGNAAAADLLAGMVLEGRGTAQDVARAIRLYEQAAAGGMEGSATRLGTLYLTNRHLPRDVGKGRRVLEAARAAGVRGADAYLLSLEAEGRSRNYQIHPSADPAKVEVRDEKLLAVSEVNPGFGFTDEFRRIHYSAYSDPALLARLEREQASLPTPYLFELARRMAAVSEEKARGYVLLAQLRLSYDVNRCVDADTAQASALWTTLIARDVQFAFRNLKPEKAAEAVRFALDREAAMPADTRPWWVCYGGLNTYPTIEEGKPVPLRLKPEAEWPALRKAAREAFSAEMATYR
jgi:hypothetical protein